VYFKERAQSGPLGARFAAVVVQRSPMTGIVAAGSELNEAVDLAGRRLGDPSTSKLVPEFQASLDHLGIPRAVHVPIDDAAPPALGRGEIDEVPDFTTWCLARGGRWGLTSGPSRRRFAGGVEVLPYVHGEREGDAHTGR